MTQFPDRLNNRLRREPTELLEVVRYNYRAELDSDVHATFPVVLRQSLGTVLLRLAKLVGVAVVAMFIAFLVTRSQSVATMAGIVASIVGVMLTGSDITFGIVAVTDKEFTLIELDKKASFGSGKVIERIDIVSNPLPEARAVKGGGMDCAALPFEKSDDRGWHYAGLTDRGTGYLTLLAQLRAFQDTAEEEKPSDHLEPQLA